MSEEDKARLGLDKSKARWFLTVAICATTRCIVAMRLSRAPHSRSAVQTIEMIMRDKGVWTDAVGALSPWDMPGTPELIVTDCGTELISFDTRVVARDLGIRIEHTPGGLPAMRARIERVLRTMSINLMPRLTGRTFGNMIEKGAYDPQARAALTADDLCAALVRWVVDPYHRSPHEGLHGETPGRCWARFSEKYGVRGLPALRDRRLAFGTRKHTITKGGITVLGVRYYTEEFARRALHARNKSVKVRWYSEDIGAIEVERSHRSTVINLLKRLSARQRLA